LNIALNALNALKQTAKIQYQTTSITSLSKFRFFSITFFWSRYDFQIYWTRIEIDYSVSIDASYKYLTCSVFEISKNREKWRKQSGGTTSKWRHNGIFFLFRISVKNPITCDPKQNSIRKRWKNGNPSVQIPAKWDSNYKTV